MDIDRAIPLHELSLSLCDAGRFCAIKREAIHSKTCPHTILAKAEQGRYEIFCGDGRHEDLNEGEAFLTGANIPLRIIHHGDPADGYKMRARWLHLHFTLFSAIDVLSLFDLPLRVTQAQCKPFGEIMDAIWSQRQADHPSLADLIRRQSLAFQALECLLRLAPLRPDSMELLRHKDRLEPVLSFMKEHLSEKLTVAQFAQQAAMSTPHFHTFFRRFMGASPMKHLKHLRLSKACQLLATSDATLQNIAEQTGFCNEFHLSRDFHRAMGKPPGTWRRDYDRSLV